MRISPVSAFFFHGESVILFRQLAKSREHFVLLSLFLGRNRHKQGGLGEADGVELYFRVLIAEGVGGGGDAEFVHRAYIARRKLGDRLRLFAFEQVNLSDAFFLFGVCVPDDAAAL